MASAIVASTPKTAGGDQGATAPPITDTTNSNNNNNDIAFDEDFDPFQIGSKKSMTTTTTTSTIEKSNYNKENSKNNGAATAATATSTTTTTTTTGLSSSSNNTTMSTSSTTKSITTSKTTLPPLIVVKFSIEEEVMSSPSSLESKDNEGSSHVFVKGNVFAQITSSNALKNSPFVVAGTGKPGTQLNYKPNEVYSEPYGGNKNKDIDNGSLSSAINVVKIPKHAIGFVNVGSYTITENVDHMPLLLEKKVSKVKSYIHVAIQVRSKLTNRSDLSDFSIALSIPTTEYIDNNNIEILSGVGKYDELKHTITWTRSNLPMGASFMVSAKMKLYSDSEEEEEANINIDDMAFPVMMRCTSQDQISSAQFQAVEASGHPASITYSTTSRSFRIIHRIK